MSAQPPRLPLGDLRLFDNLLPHLYGGEHEITVTQDVKGIAGAASSAKQRFTVSAPQISIPGGEILQQYPPPGTTGDFADVLPFVVLSEPLLPWEREMPAAGEPWLALLVFGDGELPAAPAQTPTGALTTTAGAFRKLPGAIGAAGMADEADVPDDAPCSYIEVPAALFTAIVPRLGETPYLAHVRQASALDKASGGDEPADGEPADGLFSVVVANRFPAAGTPASPAPVRNVVHLVSLEGLGPYLVEQPKLSVGAVALLSLASWSFQVVPDPADSFQGLMLDLLDAEYDPVAATHTPERIALRLAVPPSLDDAEVARRLYDGFVALAWHARSGEESIAWYRGPLTPLPTTPLAKPEPFPSADAAMIYDPAHGVFDLSLAAAWQAGRAAALANRAFGRLLLDLRRRMHLVSDELFDRVQRRDFDTPQDLAALASSKLLESKLLELLDAQVLADLDQQPPPPPLEPPGPSDPIDVQARAELRAFLGEGSVQRTLLALVAEDLDPVAQWLAGLTLLRGLPFECLVPDARMLALNSPSARDGSPLQGSLRFFYVDQNWIGALLDGALSIAIESSRQSFYHQLTCSLLQDAAQTAARALRSAVAGAEPAPTDVVSGLLLRSPVVSGWPNLAVRALGADGQSVLKTLRMDRLAPGVLLCLFEGVPAHVTFSEPQEGVRFGVDAQGAIEIRNLLVPVKDGDPWVGQPTGHTLAVRPQLTREGAGSVLDVARTVSAAGAASNSQLGPASFALQMLLAPERLRFATGAGP